MHHIVRYHFHVYTCFRVTFNDLIEIWIMVSKRFKLTQCLRLCVMAATRPKKVAADKAIKRLPVTYV